MKYYTDGYTIGLNPSPTGGGYAVVDESGKLLVHEVINKEGFTNNEGEILGLERALEICGRGDVISTDSMVALTWIHSGKSKARKDLNPLLQKLKEIVEDKKINLIWEGRDYNIAGHFNESYDSGRPE